MSHFFKKIEISDQLDIIICPLFSNDFRAGFQPIINNTITILHGANAYPDFHNQVSTESDRLDTKIKKQMSGFKFIYFYDIKECLNRNHLLQILCLVMHFFIYQLINVRKVLALPELKMMVSFCRL